MQNLVLYHLVSGHAWFTSGLVFLLVIGLDAVGVFDGRKRLRQAAHVLLIAAIVVASLTGTPVSLWLAVPLVAGCLGYICFGIACKSRKRRLALGMAAGVLVVTALALEAPYHLSSPPQSAPPSKLFVIGDSLAAGVGNDPTTWPRIIGERTSLKVRDLSAAGAATHSALRRQAPAVKRDGDPSAWVLIEIGGHDMLGASTPEEFGRDLDELLTICRGDPADPRTVLMLELPILPGKWAYGSWQRSVAARHGVVLIPKRLLAGVVLTDENVIDGLHLSAAGHERMAELLLQWLPESVRERKHRANHVRPRPALASSHSLATCLPTSSS